MERLSEVMTPPTSIEMALSVAAPLLAIHHRFRHLLW